MISKKELIEILSINKDNIIESEESTTIELKANFNKNSMSSYAKTMAAFANTDGGIIVFGVLDAGHLDGMKNTNLKDCDPAYISDFLNNKFSCEIKWHKKTIKYLDKFIGYIQVEKYNNIDKPVMCNGDYKELKSSAIYYRYSGRTEQIKPAELQKLIYKQVEAGKTIERENCIKIFNSIMAKGSKNIAIIDLSNGEISHQSGNKLIFDQDSLKQLKVIQKGKFVESEGAPTLKLVGSVYKQVEHPSPESLEKYCISITEIAQKSHLQDKGKPKQWHYVKKVIQKYNLEKNTRYAAKIGNTIRYTQECLDYIKSKNITVEQVKAF